MAGCHRAATSAGLVGRDGRARARRSTRTATSSSAPTCSAAARARTGPASSNPATGKPYGRDFPIVTIGDMVEGAEAPARPPGHRELLAVVGGSMGGMQVLEWAFATRTASRGSCVAAGQRARLSARRSPSTRSAARRSCADPDWHGGHYYDGRPANRAGDRADDRPHHLPVRRGDAREVRPAPAEPRRRTPTTSAPTSRSRATCATRARSFVDRFDANSYLYITKAMDYFDLAAKHGALGPGLRGRQGRFLVIAFSSDWLYPPYQSKEIADALRATHGLDVSYCELESSTTATTPSSSSGRRWRASSPRSWPAAPWMYAPLAPAEPAG